MQLSDTQLKEIEQALLSGNQLDAVRRYREVTGSDLTTAKAAIKDIRADLEKSRPDKFNKNKPLSQNLLSSSSARRTGLIAFVIIDLLVFVGIAWWFFNDFDSKREHAKTQKTIKAAQESRQTPFNTQTSSKTLPPIEKQRQQQKASQSATSSTPAKINPLPDDIDASTFSTDIEPGLSFVAAYEQKINNPDYIERKGSRASMSIDNLADERRIKTVRSQLTKQREVPADSKAIIPIYSDKSIPQLDGVIDEAEWSVSTSILIDEAKQTRLYFKSNGEWLFLACDTPEEKTAGGYDQFRLYLHAGMIDELVNERIHVNRSGKITSIRQTTLRWQGDPPDNEDERWKKYAINDWGIYRYAVAATHINEHRQYEAAIHMSEAGIHPGVPFTVYAEVETDPLKNDQGKFKERRYLGYFASEQAPAWMVIE